MANKDYFERFFDEKDLPERIFEVKSPNGTVNQIPNQVVIEHIKQSSGSERKQLKEMLMRLDFHNADINDFLEHLAQALAKDLP